MEKHKLIALYSTELKEAMRDVLERKDYLKFADELDAFSRELNDKPIGISDCNRLFNEQYKEYFNIQKYLREKTAKDEIKHLRSLNNKMNFFVVVTVLSFIAGFILILNTL